MPDHQSDHDLLVTLSEQVKNLREFVSELKDDIRELNDGIVKNIDKLQNEKEDKTEVQRIWREAQEAHKCFATKDEVAPLKRIVYGAVSFILLAFLGSVVYFFIPKTVQNSTYSQTTTQTTKNSR